LQGLLEREVIFKDRTETFAGKFYLKFPDYFFLSVHSPLNQIIISRGDTTLVYFPDVRKAFQSLVKNPFDPELAGSLFQAQRGWDLRGIGYTLSKEEAEGDTILRHWVPQQRAAVGAVAVREWKGRVVGVEVFDGDGRRMVETRYLRFLQSGELSIPTRIVSISLADGDTLSETIRYRRLRVNEEVPDSILNYRLPEDVEIFEE